MKKISVSGLMFATAFVSAVIVTLGDNPRDLQPWSKTTVEFLFFSGFCVVLGVLDQIWIKKWLVPTGMFFLNIFLLILGGLFIFGR